MKLGLEIAKKEHYNRLKIEGDSTMDTSIIKKLLQGTNWESITKSWRTGRLIQEIQQELKQIDYIIPVHVRHQGNKAADYLANWACQNVDGYLDRPWQRELVQSMPGLQNILTQDFHLGTQGNNIPRSGCGRHRNELNHGDELNQGDRDYVGGGRPPPRGGKMQPPGGNS